MSFDCRKNSTICGVRERDRSIYKPPICEHIDLAINLSIVLHRGLSMDWGLSAFVADSAWPELLAILNSWLEQLGKWWARLAVSFENARKTVEPVMWVVGSILALVPGSFALYKWVYYRYSRLPERLDDMLLKEERRLRVARDRLLAVIERPSPIKPFTAPIFVVPSLARAMRSMKWTRWRNGKSFANADESLETALAEIDGQLRFWGEKRANYDRQRATAYLLKGAIAAANGAKTRASGKDGAEHARIALDYFLKALEIDSSDHQALEYVAHQQRVLGLIDEAIANYLKLESVTNKPEPEMVLIRMRALRYTGELLEKKYDTTDVKVRLGEASANLREALRIVPPRVRDDLDHAFVHRYMASVEAKRGTQGWQVHAESAERMFLELIRRKRNTLEAEAGLADVRKLKKDIAATRNGSATPVDGGLSSIDSSDGPINPVPHTMQS